MRRRVVFGHDGKYRRNRFGPKLGRRRYNGTLENWREDALRKGGLWEGFPSRVPLDRSSAVKGVALASPMRMRRCPMVINSEFSVNC
jgi:hypothetical protein